MLSRCARERVREALGRLHARLRLKGNEVRMVVPPVSGPGTFWATLLCAVRVVKGNLAGKAKETFGQHL